MKTYSLLPLSAFLLATAAHALTVVWDGGGANNRLTTAGNWNPDQLPTGENTGEINDPAAYADTISDITGYHVTQNDGEVAISAKDLIDTTWVTNGGTLRGIRAMRGTSSVTMTGGDLIFGSNFNLYDDSTLTLSGGNYAINSQLAMDGTGDNMITQNGGSLTAAGAVTLANTGIRYTVNSGTATFNGGLRIFTESIFSIAGGQVNLGAGVTPNFNTSGSYINFVNNTSASLTIVDFDTPSDFEALWNSSRIRVDGANTGTFADYFVVNGSTLSLVSVPEAQHFGIILAVACLGLMLVRRREPRS